MRRPTPTTSASHDAFDLDADGPPLDGCDQSGLVSVGPVQRGDLLARGLSDAPPCVGCDDASMVEYGNGVGQGPAGQAGPGGGGGDLGAQLMNAATGAVDTVVRLPTEQLLLLIAAVIIGLFVLKRAL